MDELWRGPTTRETKLPLAEGWSILNRAVPCNPGEEVAVVRVDSLPTRDQIIDVLSKLPSGEGGHPYEALSRRYEMVGEIADAVMALFGQIEGADGG